MDRKKEQNRVYPRKQQIQTLFFDRSDMDFRLKFCFAALFLALSVTVAASPADSTRRSEKNETERKRIEILNSDFTRMIETDSGSMQYFTGNVSMLHNNALMSCDSAVMYPSGIFESFGNAKVVNVSTVVTGDSMRYDGKTARVRGRLVRLTDGSSTLRTTKVDIDTETETGYFETDGTIVDSTRLLESKRGYYYSRIKEFKFIGTVQSDTRDYLLISDSMTYNSETKFFRFFSNTHIWTSNGYLFADRGWYDSERDNMFFRNNSYILTPTREIFADTIYYEGEQKTGNMFSNVQLNDSLKSTVAMADYADFDMNTENFRLKYNSSVVIFDNADTTFLRADTVFSITLPVPKPKPVAPAPAPADSISASSVQQTVDSISASSVQQTVDSIPALNDSTRQTADTTFRQLFAFRNVKMFRNDFQMTCDSLFFSSLDSIWKLYHKPVVWDGEKMQVYSDSMKFFMKNNHPEKADYEGNAMIVTPAKLNDSICYYNQIKAKNITTRFSRGRLQTMETFGNTQTIAFSLSELSMNKAEASSMKMDFDSTGKVRRIGYYESPQGDNNPLFLVRDEDTRLPGFRYNPELRPASGDVVLGRKLRPSLRKQREALQRPSFPITKRMDEVERSAGEQHANTP
jgi:lipopolysaccharide export system protein LptA